MQLEPVYLDTIQTSKAVRERGTPELVLELCDRCWSPYLRGKLDDHLRAIPHRLPPIVSDPAPGS